MRSVSCFSKEECFNSSNNLLDHWSTENIVVWWQQLKLLCFKVLLRNPLNVMSKSRLFRLVRDCTSSNRTSKCSLRHLECTKKAGNYCLDSFAPEQHSPDRTEQVVVYISDIEPHLACHYDMVVSYFYIDLSLLRQKSTTTSSQPPVAHDY